MPRPTPTNSTAFSYIALLVTMGRMTLRGGHYWLFGLGFFVPVLWPIGAFIAPTEAAGLSE